MELKQKEKSALLAGVKFSREERKAIYRGLRKLQRPTDLGLKGGETQIIGWTRGGRYVVDRRTGETAERVRRPTVWIKYKEPEQLEDGSWEIRFEFHDEREATRMLGGGPPGVQREAGLRTRSRSKKTDEVPLTDETARGYVSGGNTIDHLEGVSDPWLDDFAREAKEKREIECPEETLDEELRRLMNKSRRLQQEAQRKGVDLRADLVAFNEKARELIVAAKASDAA